MLPGMPSDDLQLALSEVKWFFTHAVRDSCAHHIRQTNTHPTSSTQDDLLDPDGGLDVFKGDGEFLYKNFNDNLKSSRARPTPYALADKGIG